MATTSYAVPSTSRLIYHSLRRLRLLADKDDVLSHFGTADAPDLYCCSILCLMFEVGWRVDNESPARAAVSSIAGAVAIISCVFFASPFFPLRRHQLISVRRAGVSCAASPPLFATMTSNVEYLLKILASPLFLPAHATDPLAAPPLESAVMPDTL